MHALIIEDEFLTAELIEDRLLVHLDLRHLRLR